MTLPGPPRPVPPRRGLEIDVSTAPTAAARRALVETRRPDPARAARVVGGEGFRRRGLKRRAVGPVALLASVAVATTAFAAPVPGLGAGASFVVAAPASDRGAGAAADREVGISRLAGRTPIPSSAPTPIAASTPIAAESPATRPTVSATAGPTATVTPRATATPTATTRTKTLAPVTGIRYATVALNVRSAPDTSAPKVASLALGDKVSIVGAVVDGWQRVRVSGADAWVKASYVSTSKPVVPVAATAPTSTSPLTLQACASGSGVESGLTATGVRVHRAVCHAFPSITGYGGYRADSGEHSQGRALDIMVSGSLGWQVASFLRANASSLGVTEVIYQQRIWTRQRSSEGWRSMADRGSVTANHYDHVHATF